MASLLTPFRPLPSEFRAALHAFAQSTSTFKIVRTVRSDSSSCEPAAPQNTSPAPTKLFVLDSSFNPPTLGHLNIAHSALWDDANNKNDSTRPKHVLLLLATQNADKAAKPAAFEQRLTMMVIMAEDILSAFRSSFSSSSSSSSSLSSVSPPVHVSVAVTKHPYVIDKSYSIAGTDTSPPSATPFPCPPTEQVHLSGYDTFIRMLDTKYYPPKHTLETLEPFFANHSLRVTLRTGDKFGSREAQEGYLRNLAAGRREGEGGNPAWAKRIRMVEGRNEEVVTSSTTAREGVLAGNERVVEEMCGRMVARWVLEEGLYKDSEG